MLQCGTAVQCRWSRDEVLMGLIPDALVVAFENTTSLLARTHSSPEKERSTRRCHAAFWEEAPKNYRSPNGRYSTVETQCCHCDTNNQCAANIRRPISRDNEPKLVTEYYLGPWYPGCVLDIATSPISADSLSEVTKCCPLGV